MEVEDGNYHRVRRVAAEGSGDFDEAALLLTEKNEFALRLGIFEELIGASGFA